MEVQPLITECAAYVAPNTNKNNGNVVTLQHLLSVVFPRAHSLAPSSVTPTSHLSANMGPYDERILVGIGVYM